MTQIRNMRQNCAVLRMSQLCTYYVAMHNYCRTTSSYYYSSSTNRVEYAYSSSYAQLVCILLQYELVLGVLESMHNIMHNMHTELVLLLSQYAHTIIIIITTRGYAYYEYERMHIITPTRVWTEYYYIAYSRSSQGSITLESMIWILLEVSIASMHDNNIRDRNITTRVPLASMHNLLTSQSSMTMPHYSRVLS